MPRTQEVPITAPVLDWAIRESGLSADEIAGPLDVSPYDVIAWRQGSKLPTRGQFSHLTEILRRPSAMFFLKNPPTESAPKVGLRAAFGDLKRELSREERNAIRYAKGLQTLVGWTEATQSDRLPQFGFDGEPEALAGWFRERLGIKVFHQRSWSDTAVAFSSWRQALERIGFVVVQLDLGAAGIRGFSIAADNVPLAAVNTAYAYQVRIFTLFHEVAHLLTNSSSACLGFAAPVRRADRIERWCERFAGALLLPEDAVKAFLESHHPQHPDPGLDEIKAISREFHVSARASAIRLIDLGLAPAALYAAVDTHWKPLERTERRGGRAPNTPRRRLGQVGRRVGIGISRAVAQGSVTRLDALRYLKLTTGEFDDFTELAIAEA
jgi:Zn-dependent peptidase ImmA (M78 family)